MEVNFELRISSADDDYQTTEDLESSSSWVHYESRVAVAEEQGQFANPVEEECPPLVAGTRRQVKRQQTEKTTSAVIISYFCLQSKLDSLAHSP
jgi:hypothetical protein